jgi:glycosyltransferase involved in cell wall biosynthesis
MMKPKLVILNIYQLGYHTDTYNYCYFLREEYDITYASFNQGFKDLSIEGVRSISIEQPRGFLNLILGYIKLAKLIKQEKPDIVFMVYVRFISIVKFFIPRTHFIFDVRTGSLFPGELKRKLWNLLILAESLGFKYITVISEGLRNDLKLPDKKCHWLPLGGNKKDFINDYSSIRLLYIGTLDRRNIPYTIEGLEIYKRRYPEIDITYDIVGYGKSATEELLRSAIIKSKLQDIVSFHGRIPYAKIDEYLFKCNIGIVFVPNTPYYQYQPSTKLFEFLLAGVPVLATKTFENKLIVNDSNGILIDDDPEGFSSGLTLICNRIRLFKENVIQDSVSEYCWEQIVKNHLKPILYKILHD